MDDQHAPQPTADSTPATASDDAEQMADIGRLIEQKRKELGIPEYVPKPKAEPTPEQIERQKQRQEEELERRRRVEEWERQRPEREKRARWAAFVEARGCRYADCRLENFIAQTQEQRKVKTAVRAFAAKLSEHIAAGDNVLLHGPCGTGKDHLVVGLAWLAINAGRTVEWRDGATLYSDWRDSIDAKRSERAILDELKRPDVLMVSDPVPGRSAITDWQAEQLAKVMDARYNARRPVWVTANVSAPQYLDGLTIPRFADRLSEGNSLSLFMNWESWRQRKNVAAG